MGWDGVRPVAVVTEQQGVRPGLEERDGPPVTEEGQANRCKLAAA